jgi:ribonuclease HII
MRILPTFEIENEVLAQLPGGSVIAGVDEAGRGPLCGPVVAAAVIFKFAERRAQNEDINNYNCALRPANFPLIADSKQMTAAQRAAAFDWIMQNCGVGVGQCSPAEIDELNILHASMLAMKRAVATLPLCPDFVLADGNRMPPNLTGRAVVKGDSKSLSIAAASIIAKETRDRIMRGLSDQFPEYGWDKNAGYPTPAHLRSIKEFGINEHYRKTFAPVARVMEKK